MLDLQLSACYNDCIETTHKEHKAMTRTELQAALKSFKAQGLTNIKLNSKKDELQTEYNRLTGHTTPKTELIDELMGIAIKHAVKQIEKQVYKKLPTGKKIVNTFLKFF